MFSLLPMLSRLFENIVFGHMKGELLPLYGCLQLAYTPEHCTSTALLAHQDSVTRMLDCDPTRAVRAVFIDMFSGFNRVRHDLLLARLAESSVNSGLPCC